MHDTAMLNEHGATAGPTSERIVMLTDAVVAIAMTLLVLPLVDAVPEVELDNVGQFLAGHPSLLLGYGLSFVVIYLFWSAHHWVFAAVAAPPLRIRVLNLLWLLSVAFIPFPTALIGREPTPSTAPIYIGTMLVVAVLTAALTQIAGGLQDADVDGRLLANRAQGLWAASAVIAVCAVLSRFYPDAGLIGLLVIIPVRAYRRGTERRIAESRRMPANS
jgi:uncharacterized membrane protein